jgi:molecular chaperone DnaK
MIGIDLGTTNSCVAVMEGGVPQVIPNQNGARGTPSVVAVTAGGDRLVGCIAKRQAVTNPRNTVYALGRLIGRKFDSAETKKARALLPFELVAAPNGDVRIRVEEQDHSPSEISSLVLRKLKGAAEDYLGEPVEDAVITVPALFTDPQRRATRDAGLIAGFRGVVLLNGPVAAALAYGLKRSAKSGPAVAVYDLGGGTFGITILEMADGLVQVRAAGGDTCLGGEDFDQRIVDWLIRDFGRETGLDLKQDRIGLQRLKEAAERAKCELSTARQAEIVVPFVSADTSGPRHLRTVLTRQGYEELTHDLLERTVEPCRRCLADAGMRPEQIDQVLVVGGQTHASAVAEIVRRVFGREPNREVDPFEGAAIGAAIQAGIIQGELGGLVLRDVATHTLGIEADDGTFTPLIERNRRIPARQNRAFTTVVDGQRRVEVRVLQGESARAAANECIARLEFTDIPAAPRGVPQLEVSFGIDANGIVSGESSGLATGRCHSMAFRASGGLDPAAVDRLAAETRAREQEERPTRERDAVVRQLDGLVANTMRSVQALAGQLTLDEQQHIHTSIDRARRAPRLGGLEELRARLSEMEAAAGIIGQAMLRAASWRWLPPVSPRSVSTDDGSHPPVSAPTSEWGGVKEALRLILDLGTMAEIQVRWDGELAARFEPTEFETLGGEEIKRRGRLTWVESPAAGALLARLNDAHRRVEDGGIVEIDRPRPDIRAYLRLVSPSTGEALLYMRVQR